MGQIQFSMETFAPDTNFFLQCASAEQLDWRLVTQADHVILVVVRQVRKELDRLKSGGNQRRAKRARTASSLLRRFTSEKIDEIELRSEGPRVVLRIAARPDESALPSNFPIDSADERMISEVYAANSAAVDGVTFLSHDSVPLEDAAQLGLRTQEIPDAWLLDPESSDLEKQLADVRRRMTALEGRAPKIEVHVPADEKGVIVLTTRFFPQLSEGFIDRAMRAVQLKYPPGPSAQPGRLLGSAFADLHQADEVRWGRYLEEHSKWSEEIRDLLHDAASYFTEDPNAAPLSLSIKNSGSAGADNLIVRIEALGHFHLADPDVDHDGDELGTYFPVPPRRPRSALIDEMMALASPSFSGRTDYMPRMRTPRFHTPVPARDRHVIYWDYEDERHNKKVEGQCREFRHGLPSDEVVLLVERDAIGDEPIDGALDVLVSAGNLVEAERQTHRVCIEAERMDTEQLARDLLKRELGVEVR